jgi:PAS domain S-box-containing protein
MKTISESYSDFYFLKGGGEMGDLIRATDWSKTALGDPGEWPQSLRTSVAMVLDNPFGMYIAWGDEFIQLYNDGYRPILGSTKHPQALGIGTRETFSEIWHIIGPMFEGVMQGKAVGFPDFMLPLNRNGFVEECYFDFSYSPIRKDDGKVGGVLVTVIETTEKRKAIAALKESEERFRTMAEAADILIAISDSTSNAVYFNKAWSALTGRSVEELMNFGWADLIHEKDRQRFVDIYLNAFEKRENWKGEFRMLSSDGTYRCLLAKGVARFHSDNTFSGYISSSVDITDQVSALKKAEESGEDLRSMVAHAPIGICVLDAASLTSEIVNERFIEVAGKPYEEIAGRFYWDSFAEARPYYESALNEVVTNGIPFSVNEVPLMLIRHGKEEIVYVTFVYAPLKEANGKVKKVAVWVVENTQQVLSRQKVEESEQEIRSLIEGAPFPIGVYKGREMRVAFANESIMEIWGKGKDVIGELFSEVLPELDNQEVFKQLDEVYTTGVPFHIKNQRLDLMVNGKVKPYYFNYSLTPLFDAAGHVYGVMNTGADVTDLNMAKLELQESENKLRNTILQAPIAMCIFMGPNHVVELANDRMFELWGKPAEAFMNKPLFEGLYEAKDQGFEELLDSVYNTGKTVAAEGIPVTLPRKGILELVYVNILYQAYKDTDGTITGILAIAIDVTAQVIARKKIEEAEEKARLAINSAELGVYEIVYATDEMNTDKRFKEIWGFDHPALRHEYAKVIHPDDLLHRQLAHDASLKTGQLDYQTRVIWKDKSIHWVRITGKVLFDDKGEPSKLIGVAQDVTAPVIAQKKIEESEQNLRNTILQAPVAMCIFKGPQYVVELANEKMFELWGKPFGHMMRKPVFEALPEIIGEGFDKILDGVYKTGETFSAQGIPVTLLREGKPRTVYINAVYSAYHEPDGAISGILAVAIDVTPQVTARQKIEEVVAERTKDLAEANNSLHKSNAELAQFAYIASHDLQEPLRKITTFSQMLQNNLEGKLDDKSRNYLNKINNSSTRMNKLIRDVLTYSELVKENELYTEVDLNEIVESIKTDYDLLIEQKAASVNCSGLPVIEAIPLQMSQLFGNLISNALKFARKDVPPVINIVATKLGKEEVKSMFPEQDQDYYRIRISDNGIGFKQEYAEQIFSIFQRLHRKSEYEGTGIGLAMCKKIALNHHGDLNASDSSENGAVFNLILPAKQLKKAH